MDSNVLLQVLGQAEAFMTVVTAEWPFISVDHLMSVQILQKSESSTTSFTLVGTSFIA